MNFWDMRDLALLKLRKEAIEIIEDFERNNIKDEDCHKKINRLINKRLGNKIRFIVKCSLTETFRNMDFSKI